MMAPKDYHDPNCPDCKKLTFDDKLAILYHHQAIQLQRLDYIIYWCVGVTLVAAYLIYKLFW